MHPNGPMAKHAIDGFPTSSVRVEPIVSTVSPVSLGETRSEDAFIMRSTRVSCGWNRPVVPKIRWIAVSKRIFHQTGEAIPNPILRRGLRHKPLLDNVDHNNGSFGYRRGSDENSPPG